MGRKSKQVIEIEIINPEALDRAKEKVTEYAYQKYKEKIAQETLDKRTLTE